VATLVRTFLLIGLRELSAQLGSLGAGSEVIAQLVRLQYDYQTQPGPSVVDVNLEDSFNGITVNKAQRRTLTLLHEKEVQPAYKIPMGFVDMETYLMQLAPVRKKSRPNHRQL